MPKPRLFKTKGLPKVVDTGNPSNFCHVQQVKWDPENGFQVNVSDENIRKYFDGVLQSQPGNPGPQKMCATINSGKSELNEDMARSTVPEISLKTSDPLSKSDWSSSAPPSGVHDSNEEDTRKSSDIFDIGSTAPTVGCEKISDVRTDEVRSIHNAEEARDEAISLESADAKQKRSFRTTLTIQPLTTFAQRPEGPEGSDRSRNRRVSLIVVGKTVFWQKLKDSVHGRSLLKRTVWNSNPLISIEDAKILQHTDSLSDVIAKEIIGKYSTFNGPFGIRTCLYVDTTASGKPLAMIEDFIQNQVLPFYANTHTEISHTSHVTSSYRCEAREIVREAVGADEDDVVIFYGSGSTGVVNKLVHALGVEKLPVDQKPVVLIGPYEHHSNLLPWRESGALVINVAGDRYGCFDINALETTLKEVTTNPEYSGRAIYGSFSAGSNVTGTVVDDIKVTSMMHEYGGLCFWDFAAAAPHVKIAMNPSVGSKRDNEFARKDAIRGTSFRVVPKLQNREEAEEGGTPGILQSIRLGLVFSLHESIGIENVISREAYFTRKAIHAWSNTPGIIILGNLYRPRLPIVSFLIEHLESGFYLHYSYVVALLNDLFGIQCRGGCMCAGPYAIKLLGITPDVVKKYQEETSEDVSDMRPTSGEKSGEPSHLTILRPGFARVSFSFDLSDDEVDFLIEAVKIIARDGWRLLPLYSMDPLTGSYSHCSKLSKAAKKGVTSLRQIASKIANTTPEESTTENRDFSAVLQDAIKIINSTLDSVEETMENNSLEDSASSLELKVISSNLRWFMTSTDAISYMNSNDASSMRKSKSQRLFTPPTHSGLEFHNLQRALTRHTLHSIPYQLARSVV